MKVAVDVSPLRGAGSQSHSVRGIGFYVENLLSSLQKSFPQTDYMPFTNLNDIPSGADLVHFTYFDPFFMHLPIIKKQKYIVTVHDMIPLLFPQDFPVGIKGKIRLAFQKNSLRVADKVIAVSNASKADTNRILGISQQKINVVYNAASDVFSRSVSTEEMKRVNESYGLPSKFVLYVGDATANKNLPRIIRSTLQTKYQIVLVGSTLGKKAKDIQEHPWNRDLCIALELSESNISRVFRLGFVPLEDLVVIYRLASVLLMPSLYEGFGLPVLEAMKSGCPVITSERGSLPEVAGSAAFYVNPEREASIADGIHKIVESNEIRKKLIEDGKKQADKFSWNECARFTQKLYSEVYSS